MTEQAERLLAFKRADLLLHLPVKHTKKLTYRATPSWGICGIANYTEGYIGTKDQTDVSEMVPFADYAIAKCKAHFAGIIENPTMYAMQILYLAGIEHLTVSVLRDGSVLDYHRKVTPKTIKMLTYIFDGNEDIVAEVSRNITKRFGRHHSNNEVVNTFYNARHITSTQELVTHIVLD